VTPTSFEREVPTQDLAQLHADYIRKLHNAMGDDRADIVSELSAGYAEEARLVDPAQEPAPGKHAVGQARSLLHRLDRYTLQAYNPSWPHRTGQSRREQ
jgi:hypothetical protein